MYRRSDLTLRELSDMLPSNEQRDTVKYLSPGFRSLIEQRHYATSDDSEPVDNGDALMR
jgi:hypothetical protein